MEYTTLRGLKVSDYEYPGENNAFALLKKIPLLDQIAESIIKLSVETNDLPRIQGDCYRITKDTCPDVYELYQIALKRLDMPREYPLYVKCDFDYNACAVGSSCIYINSSVINNFQPDELLVDIGHELGHIKSGHVIYSYMASNLQTLISRIPIVGSDAAAIGMYFALMNWKRMHEFTADRAGAIAAGNMDAVIRNMQRYLSADDGIPAINLTAEDVLKQYTSFKEEQENIVTKLICVMQIAGMTHPWMIERVKALQDWQDSGEFNALISRYA